jgi:hypothetical protein
VRGQVGKLRLLGGKHNSTDELSPSGCGRIASGCRTEGGGIEGVAVRALDTSRAEGTTAGIALRAPGPLPPSPVPRAADTAVALVANLGTATCTEGCAGLTCVGGRARHSHNAGPSYRQPLHEYRITRGVVWWGRWSSGCTLRRNSWNGQSSGGGR